MIPLVLFIVRVWKREDTPNSILDHMFTAFIFLGLDGYIWISLPKNTIKIGRVYIFRAFTSVFLFYLRVCEHNWPLWIGPCQFLNSSLYWYTGIIQSLSSSDPAKQFILESGSIPDLGTKELSSSLYNPLHRGMYKLSEDPSTLSNHLTTTMVHVPPYRAWLLIISPSLFKTFYPYRLLLLLLR